VGIRPYALMLYDGVLYTKYRSKKKSLFLLRSCTLIKKCGVQQSIKLEAVNLIINKQNPYDVEEHIAEIYDREETTVEDVELITELLIRHQCRNVLEPFCGTGRILLPIAKLGVTIVGMDGAKMMLNRLEEKLDAEPESVKNNVSIIHSELMSYSWPAGFDAVILGGNFFFEFASLEEQQKILNKAYHSVKKGGYIFISSDSIEKELPDYWCNVGVENRAFPSGVCKDGAELKAYSKPVYVDRTKKIWKAERRLEVYENNKLTKEYSWEIQKHPIGYSEIIDMINMFDLEIIESWGDIKTRKPFSTGDDKAALWLRKK